MKKKLFLPALVLLFTLIMGSTTFAAEAIITKKYVDSNSWTYITSAQKNTYGSIAEIKVTNIYTASGGSSTYVYVLAKATSEGPGAIVTKGFWKEVNIPDAYRSAESNVKLYCMGRVPFLDCQISGYWNVH